MFLLDIVQRSVRSLLSAKARTLLTAFAMAVGAFALSLTLAASNGATNYADNIVKSNFDPSELIVSASKLLFSSTDTSKPQEYNQNFSSVLTPGGTSTQVENLSDSDITRLKAIDGVESIRTTNTVSLQYVTRDGQRKYSGTVQAYSSYKSPELLAGSVSGSLASKTVILPEGFLSSLGFSSASDAVGKKIRLGVQEQVDQSSLITSFLQNGSASTDALAQNTTTETDFKIVAVSKTPAVLLQPSAGLYLTANEDDLNTLKDISVKGTTSYHKYLSVYIKVKDGTDINKLTAVQDQVKKLGYGAQSVLDTQKTITQVITVLQSIVLVFGLIAVVASVFGVVNTMYISVLQRTQEIGLMKALGMHKYNINQLFLFEAALIGLLGGLIGSAIAVGAGTLLNPSISKLLNTGDVRILDFHIDQIVMLVLALTVVAMVAGFLPARKAARLDPIDALRTE
ncbi:MAG: ABC transporter permease [Candidatus Saccharimonadales bacterium]